MIICKIDGCGRKQHGRLHCSAHYMQYLREKMPWYQAFSCARTRCSVDKRYVGNGIKFLMVLSEFKYMWFRDKGYEMRQPSIDRINPKGNYELENCRFLERSENARRSQEHKMRSINQVSLDGKLIKNYPSIRAAVVELNKPYGVISGCLLGKSKSAYGYRWEYADIKEGK